MTQPSYSPGRGVLGGLLTGLPQSISTQPVVRPGDVVNAATVGTTETPFESCFTIPANSLVVGQVVEVVGYGTYTSTPLGPSQRPRVRIGPAATAFTSRMVAIDGGPITGLLNSVPGAQYRYEAMFCVQSLGVAAVLRCAAALTFVTVSNGQSVVFMAGPTPGAAGYVTVDSTVANVVGLSVQFSAGVAGNNNTLMLQRALGLRTP